MKIIGDMFVCKKNDVKKYLRVVAKYSDNLIVFAFLDEKFSEISRSFLNIDVINIHDFLRDYRNFNIVDKAICLLKQKEEYLSMESRYGKL